MKNQMRAMALGLTSVLAQGGFSSVSHAQGTAFTYQGRLNDGAGPANGMYDLRFAIYDSASGGSLLAGPLTNSSAAITNGLFTATLDFGAVFPGAGRWLEMGVRTNGSGSFATLAPRQPLTPSPYAITAENVMSGGLAGGVYGNAVTFNNLANSFSGNGGGLTNVNATTLGGLGPNAFWRTTGNAGTTPGANFLGTADNQPLELQVNGTRALRLEPHATGSPSLVGGYLQNSVAGFYGSVIAGGGSNASPNGVSGNYAFIGAGHGASAGNFSAVVGGAFNNSSGNFGLIGTGLSNTNLADYSFLGSGANNLIGAGSDYSLISGGQYNFIQSSAQYATIGGGIDNRILTNGDIATIGGGHDNTIQSARFSVIGGGGYNMILVDAYDSTIGGGGYNTIHTNSHSSTIGGGAGNMINTNTPYSTVSGGYANTIDTNAPYSTIGGGAGNTIQANSPYATIVGGVNNLIQTNADIATIAGGHDNTIQSAPFSIIGGGGLNRILLGAHDAVIGGGGYNTIQTNSLGSTIGGGDVNTVDTNSPYGTIGGGNQNTIQPNSPDATIAGGVNNTIQTNAPYSMVGGGYDNTIQPNASSSTIAGGLLNTIQTNAYVSTIGGGGFNTIQTNAYYSTIGGGGGNTIQTKAYYSTVGGGLFNTIQTNASFAVVPGGSNNVAAGNYSFAAGQRAQALHTGSFVWADSQNAVFTSTTNDQFNVRAQGGVRFVTGGAGLSVDGEPAPLLNAGQTFSGANVFNNPSNSFIGDGTGLTNVNAAAVGGLSTSNLWQLGGNSGNPNTILGTLDNGQPLTIFAGGYRVLSLNTAKRDLGPFGLDGTSIAANLAGGSEFNTIWSGVLGGTIAGGGKKDLYLSYPPIWPHPNIVSDDFGTIGGGADNLVGNTNTDVTDVQAATVAGGAYNQATSSYAVVGGGIGNQASGPGSAVGGGGYDGVVTSGNVASGASAVVAGGIQNSAANNYASVGGGAGNVNHGYAATVGGGWYNFVGAASYATVAGGRSNNAAGLYATVPGGFNNLASGAYSFAAGQQAQALHTGSFVWADSQPAGFASSGNDQFNIRARGGIQLSPDTSLFCGTQTRQMLNLWSTNYGIGVQSLTMYFRVDSFGSGGGFAWYKGGSHSDSQYNPGAGGTLMMHLDSSGNLFTSGAVNPPSDRNLKQGFEPVNAREVLEKVAALPVESWEYKDDSRTRHIGPVAQDFYAAFHIGTDDKHIATVDADGVALAAIQGLNQKVETERLKTDSLEQKLEQKETEISELKQTVTRLKELVQALDQKLSRRKGD